MPIQTPQWTDFLICPICCNEYDKLHNPVSLGCGHTLCKCCLSKLQRKQCPYDQATITIDIIDLPINYALLQLVSSGSLSQPERSQIQSKLQKNAKLSAEEFQLYCDSLKYVEDIALYLKPFSSAVSSSSSANVLSRPMQRKLVMLINCQLLEEEGRIRALKAARSLGERTVTELIIQHQNPQQLSTNLWAAVRARGCQFLGPAMQEEVLKLVLLALEDGSALSRKVLVMFVVQRLEPHFPQASKTSIGHVVQLLYRASCFVVSKREGDSSLMKLKEEFRTYDALRREHDAQIVEIATEAGLRIAPDQWSALLYGDTAHKSHMQSIIDKLQNPQSFAQSVQELVIALQRTGDPGNLCTLRPHLEYLADIDVNQDLGRQIWIVLNRALEAALIVVSGLVNFIKTHGCRKSNLDSGNNITVHASKYKISLCRDFTVNGMCPRGVNCTFAHSDEELVKYRSKHRKYQRKDSDGTLFSKCSNNNNLSNSKLGFEARLEECCRGARKNVSNDQTNCFCCKTRNYSAPEYEEKTLMPLNEMIYPSRFIGSHTSTSSNIYKVPSSQYLAAMNHRKQKIISELQQVLSDVQSQQAADNYTFDVSRSSSVIYDYSGSLPNPDYFMNSLLQNENLNSNENYLSPQPNLGSLPPLTFERAFRDCGTYSTSGDWDTTDFQTLTTSNNAQTAKYMNHAPLYATPEDWNINYSKLCQNCNVTNNSSVEKNLLEENSERFSAEEHESLLLESAKLQDQLRGLKKKITDIKDASYEEGIVNDLRALEIRLECELAEEEKKLWPLEVDQ